MCKVVDYYMNQGRMEGLRDGRLEGKCGIIFEMVQDGDISIQVAASRLNLSTEEIADRMIAGGYRLPAVCWFS